MRITARRAPTSTCPLCRAEVARRLGIRCSTCGAVAHRECVRELGGCHGTQVQGDPVIEFGLSDTPEDRRRARARREQFRRAQETPPPHETDGGEVTTVLLCLWGVSLVVAAIFSGFASGLGGVGITAFMGLLGPIGFYQAWSGLRTGVVETTAKDSQAEYSWEDQPLSFVFHVTLWAIWGFAFTALAFLPMLAD